LSVEGRHLLLNAAGISGERLREAARWNDFFVEAVRAARATMAEPPRSVWFDNGGMTAFVMLTESHLAVHTWPEHGRCALDCYTCGTADPEAVVAVFPRYFSPEALNVRRFERGW